MVLIASASPHHYTIYTGPATKRTPCATTFKVCHKFNFRIKPESLQRMFRMQIDKTDTFLLPDGTSHHSIRPAADTKFGELCLIYDCIQAGEGSAGGVFLSSEPPFKFIFAVRRLAGPQLPHRQLSAHMDAYTPYMPCTPYMHTTKLGPCWLPSVQGY
jgi:hypothetical protein